jgi:hypothetical protein
MSKLRMRLTGSGAPAAEKRRAVQPVNKVKLLPALEKKSKFESKRFFYELKKHKPRFDEGSSKFLDHRKQNKLQWLKDPTK